MPVDPDVRRQLREAVDHAKGPWGEGVVVLDDGQLEALLDALDEAEARAAHFDAMSVVNVRKLIAANEALAVAREALDSAEVDACGCARGYRAPHGSGCPAATFASALARIDTLTAQGEPT